MTLSSEREGRLTASVFASAIGVGYDSRQKLWRQLTGREPKFEGNAATEWGSANEANAIDQYQAITGNLLDACGRKQAFVIHPVHNWLGCTPDGTFCDTVIEAKCPASMNLYGEIPDHYMPQVQGQMAITGKPKAHFICWTPETIEVYEVEFSPEYWSACMIALSEFYDYWKNDIEPKRKAKPVLPKVHYTKII